MKSIGVGVFVVFTGLLGCSSSSHGTATSDVPPPTNVPFACEIGSLTGTWHVTYSETDGNCGRVPAETIVFPTAPSSDAGAGDAGASDAGASACVIAANTVSADKCRIDLDYTCPLQGVKGSQRWAGTLRQVHETQLHGSLTLQVTESTATCRSTYNVDWLQQ